MEHKKLLLISFDAVGSEHELPVLRTLPNFRQIFGSGTVIPGMNSVFVSNTYPIHASIATGVVPARHGVISNTKASPDLPYADWNYDSRLLRAEPLWMTAARKGLTTAAVMWPVTAYARKIRWNIPEIMVKPGENQIMMNLRCGSVLPQILGFLRHRKLLRGIEQPERDSFAAYCMRDIILAHHPDLMLMHLTAYDSLCHAYGRGSEEAITALSSLDENLGLLADAVSSDTVIMAFSDHAQLNVSDAYDPNCLLEALGFLKIHPDGTMTDLRAYFQNADGSTFLLNRDLTAAELIDVRKRMLAQPSVERQLRDDEMKQAGFTEIGFAAAPGYYFHHKNVEKATHGYPLDRPDYHIFCAVSEPGFDLPMNSVLDIHRAACHILGLG